MSDLPHEKNDPIYMTRVILDDQVTPPSIWVQHFTKNGGIYNRGNQYTNSSFTWSPIKYAWTGINNRNPKLVMYGVFEQGDNGWTYSEVLATGLKLEYISLSACVQVSPSVR